MPTYDYRCKKCDHKWETFQSIKAPATRKCPDCGKQAAERVIGPGAAVIFKGSGFYQTDYRSDAYKKAADADKPAAPAKSEGSSPASNGSSTAGEKKSSLKAKD
jgi:putative FmdB family regulatory protein